MFQFHKTQVILFFVCLYILFNVWYQNIINEPVDPFFDILKSILWGFIFANILLWLTS